MALQVLKRGKVEERHRDQKEEPAFIEMAKEKVQ